MSKVIVGMIMSLDGFINDRNGDGGSPLSRHGTANGDRSARESIRDTGAVVMGRRTSTWALVILRITNTRCPYLSSPTIPPTEEIKGQNENLTITFVTDGIESAMEKARAAAGEKDVTIVGGASTAQQCLKAGLADELHSALPSFPGEGLRYFDPDATSQNRA